MAYSPKNKRFQMHLKPPPTLVSGEVAHRQSGAKEGAAYESARVYLNIAVAALARRQP